MRLGGVACERRHAEDARARSALYVEQDVSPGNLRCLMDRITKSYVDKFRQEQSLPSDMSDADLFELFAIYCAVSSSYDEEFDTASLGTGGDGDLSTDGIAVIVNGVLVSSIDEAEDLLVMNTFLDVKFVFVQAKSGSGFNGQEIGAFFDGVEEFYSETPVLPVNGEVQAARDLMNWIYTQSVSFKKQRPTVELYFVTTGQWTGDAYLGSLIDQKKKRLQETHLFEHVAMRPWGASEVQAAYQRSKNNVTVEFTFTSRVTLPEIEGVSEAYLGVIPASEYLALVTDDAGNIRKPLFYDNVRDFQGENAVNREIKATLDDPTGQRRFVILNNGVTLVARDLKPTGNKFAVSDYQIVNGCQTSHVLFNERDVIGDEAYIPIKVISTADEDIINSIITATNRQTEVTADDLFAMSGFQKKLESLYESYPGKKKLYYERRSKQYASVDGIEKVRIIDKTQQVRVFAAMFLDDPHRAVRYYSELRNQVGSKIFVDAHQLEPYYVSAYAYYKLEFFFRNTQLPSYYKPARYHLLMVFRYLVATGDMPQFTANKMQKYATEMAESLWSDTKSVEIFKKALEVIDAAAGAQSLTRDLVKTQTFTDAVKKSIKP
jgi:hypothetical protein